MRKDCCLCLSPGAKWLTYGEPRDSDRIKVGPWCEPCSMCESCVFEWIHNNGVAHTKFKMVLEKK